MIKTVTGDILLSKARAIAHGIAPNDHFDQGLALSLREQHPALAKDFRHYCHLENPPAGQIWTWISPTGQLVVNLLTQDPDGHGGKPGPAKLEHVNHALRELAKLIQSEKITSIALPKIANGVGKLEWDDVKPLIEKHLGTLGINVIIYETYQKGLVADEG
jgi:O-acetyl-ADP-ribose deacetylase (regulator of RNase III)